MAEGTTGAIKNQVPWPTGALPHAYNNFRLAMAKCTPGAPNEIAVFTDFARIFGYFVVFLSKIPL